MVYQGDSVNGLFQTAIDVVIVIDLEKQEIIEASTAASNLLDYCSKELIGLHFKKIFYDYGVGDNYFKELYGYHEGRIFLKELVLKKKDGSKLPVILSGTLIKLNSGNQLHLVAKNIEKQTSLKGAIRNRDDLLQALSFAGEVFLKTDDWSKGINLVLDKLGLAANVNRIYIFRNRLQDNDQVCMQKLFEWQLENDSKDFGREITLPFNRFGSKKWEGKFWKNEFVTCNIRDLLGDEKLYHQERNVKSILAVPIFIEDKWWGIIGFDECREEREWSNFLITTIKSIANIIGAALHKLEVEKALKESEERSQIIFKYTGSGLYHLNFDTMKYDFMSSSIESLTGYSVREFNDMGFSSIIKKSIIQFSENIHSEEINYSVREEIDEYEADILIKTKDGKERWLNDRSSAWKDENGKIVGSVGILRDITKRRDAEEKLRRHNAIIKTVRFAAESFLSTSNWKEKINDVLKMFGEAAEVTRTYIFRNRHDEKDRLIMERIFEWLNSKTNPHVDPPEYRTIIYAESGFARWEKKLSKGEIIIGNVKGFPENEKRILGVQGVKSILIVPIFAGNQFWGFIGFDEHRFERDWSIQEIEALKAAGDTLGSAIQRIEYEEQLIKAKDTAEKSDRLKSEFLASISHEIRTPVNSILSFSALIKNELEKVVSEDLQTAFQMVENGGFRLIRTIDLILNMSELQLGTYQPYYQKLNLSKDVLHPLIEEFEIVARSKGLTLQFENGYGACLVWGDKYSLTQIFINIIDNAIKYTEEGKINIKISKCENKVVQVDILDTGIGISKDYLPQLFEPFTQEEGGYTRKFEGTGLGLSLAKNYCEINNADINVKSEKGKGSLFSVTFHR